MVLESPALALYVSLAQQSLEVRDAQHAVLARYPVSTAARGAGEQRGSYQTPRGRHYIRAKIGAAAPLGAVFKARRATGEVWTPALAAQYPDRDWILTRILWLCGCEPGRNRLGPVDTMARYIYIHGTPDTEPMGQARSHGCIRMCNADLLELFAQVVVGTPVTICESF